MPLSPPRTCSATSASIARTRAGCVASPNKLLAPVAPITRQLWLGGGSSGMAFDAYLPAGVRRIVGRDFPQDNTGWREKMKTRPAIRCRRALKELTFASLPQKARFASPELSKQ